jgi:hypothetical protein
LGPRSLLPNGYRHIFLRGVQQSGLEADNWPQSSVQVKNTWIYLLPPHVFMA